jgi:hypothetical protein
VIGLGGGKLFRHGKPTTLRENILTENSGTLYSGVVQRFDNSETNIYFHVNFKEILVGHEERGILRSRSRPLA